MSSNAPLPPLRVWPALWLADTELPRVVGYLCHRASVRLQEVASGLLRPAFRIRPLLSMSVYDEEWEDITLPDVAPRTAEAIDWLRGKWSHVCWVASNSDHASRRRRVRS